MTEPTPDTGPLLTPADLVHFATIAPAKAQEMIDDAIGTAFIHAPCLLDPSFPSEKRAAAKAILRGAVLRWNEAGSGAVVMQSSMSYAQTVDTRQQRRVMFFSSEIDALKQLCRPDGEDRGAAFAIDIFPQAAPQLSAREAFERNLDAPNW